MTNGPRLRARLKLALALGVTLEIGGCALIGDGDPGDRRRAWLAYLGGDDLRNACDAGLPDRLRLITRKRGHPDFQTLDVIGTLAGGAVAVLRKLRDDDFDRHAPMGAWRNEGERWLLTPPEMSALITRLDREGTLTPPQPGAPPPPTGAVTWLISGCLDGLWFLNLPAGPTDDDPIGAPTGWPQPEARPTD